MYYFEPVWCKAFNVYHKEMHLYRVQTCSVRRCHSRSVYCNLRLLLILERFGCCYCMGFLD